MLDNQMLNMHKQAASTHQNWFFFQRDHTTFDLQSAVEKKHALKVRLPPLRRRLNRGRSAPQRSSVSVWPWCRWTSCWGQVWCSKCWRSRRASSCGWSIMKAHHRAAPAPPCSPTVMVVLIIIHFPFQLLRLPVVKFLSHKVPRGPRVILHSHRLHAPMMLLRRV